MSDVEPPANFDMVTEAHGILASIAWVIFFPLGAIVLRLLKGRAAIYAHVVIQLFALALATSSFGSGVWMVIKGGFDFADYHPAIGVVVFSFVWTQPISGLAHHLQYKRVGGRTIVSHLHVWIGRCLITIGMIEGGLGMYYADGDSTTGENIAYGVVAAFLWLVYISVVIYELVIKKHGAPESLDGKLMEKKSIESGDSTNVGSSAVDLPGADVKGLA